MLERKQEKGQFLYLSSGTHSGPAPSQQVAPDGRQVIWGQSDTVISLCHIVYATDERGRSSL